MHKIGIIGPYKDDCGIATYLAAIYEEAKKQGFDVEIIETKTNFLNNTKYEFHRKKFEKSVINRAKDFKLLNIQFEPGVFGSTKFKAYKFLLKICKACSNSNILITCHHFNIGQPITYSNKGKTNFFKALIKICEVPFKKVYYFILLKLLKRITRLKNVKFLFHRPDLAEEFKYFYNNDEVFSFPLCYSTYDEMKQHKTPETRIKFLEKYKLDQNNIYIGIVGFLDNYKGYDLVIKALSMLPSNYHLVFSGTIHSTALRNGISKEHLTYVQKFFKSASEKNVESRIHYINFLNEADFKELIGGCDFITLPYREVGQHASGPLSYALSLNHASKIITSNTIVFTEYLKLFPNCFQIINIESPNEIAYKILHWDKNNEPNIMEAAKKYNITEAVKLYIKLMQSSED